MHTDNLCEYVVEAKGGSYWYGVKEIRFRTDASFVTYDTIDCKGESLSTKMIPLTMIGHIQASRLESEFVHDEHEIRHLAEKEKESLK
jgi:hypothetical protein